jgi:hypothetical protein
MPVPWGAEFLYEKGSRRYVHVPHHPAGADVQCQCEVL